MKLIGKLASNDTSKFGILPSASKDFSKKIQNDVYTVKILNKYWMDSKLVQKFKTENNYSNINHVYTMLKGTPILTTEV